MAACNSCGQQMSHFDNPPREVCTNPKCSGPKQDSSTGTRKLSRGVTRNPAKTRKNTGKRGDQGKHR
jgi:hypothetical protein